MHANDEGQHAEEERSLGVVLPTSLKKPFNDLKLTGVVLEDRCYRLQGNVLRIYLQLSASPPLGWAFMFSSSWQALEYEGKPQAGVEGDAVWIECSAPDVRLNHLSCLERCVAQANACFRPWLQHKAQAQTAQRQLDSQARAQLRELRQKLEPQAPAPPEKKTLIGRLWAAVLAAISVFKRTLRGTKV